MTGLSNISLPALRVFVAVGHAMSFSRAADALGITQAAVSHQIRVIEDQIGARLFMRSTRRLQFTAIGRELFSRVAGPFAALGDAVNAVRSARHTLSITTTAAFGAKWLGPRLQLFAEAHPGIELVVRHTERCVDLAAEGVDIAIRGGGGNWPGLIAELIGEANSIAVASPAYIKKMSLDALCDLRRANLLHCDSREDWRLWLLANGLEPELSGRGNVIGDEGMIIEAALAGQGVALAVSSLAASEIASGRLRIIPGATPIAGYGYYLAYVEGALDIPKLRTFREFVLSQGRASFVIR